MLALSLPGCGGGPTSAYMLPPMLGKPGPGRITMCYNRITESTESLRARVLEVCRDPALISNEVDLDYCSLASPVAARFDCAFVVRSLAEERPPMPPEPP